MLRLFHHWEKRQSNYIIREGVIPNSPTDPNTIQKGNQDEQIDLNNIQEPFNDDQIDEEAMENTEISDDEQIEPNPQ